MKVGVYSNLNKDADCAVTKKLIKALQNGEIPYFVHSDAAKKLGFDGCTIDALINKTDIIISIGGDGTMLSIAAKAAQKGRELLGINMGHRGFLAEAEPEEIEAAIEKLASNDYFIEERSILKIICGGKNGYALNELAVNRKIESRLVSIKAYSDGNFIDSYYADGFIVSTPTGSTAYALSAGGPILSPGIKAFLLLPICSHALHNKPIVVSDNEKILIKPDTDDFECSLILDGLPFSSGKMSEVRVERADFNAKFIRFKKHDFYTHLFNKLNYWSS